jgi:transcription elongation GreA/GreB family factor
MDTYNVVVLKGDLSKPLIRQSFDSIDDLIRYLEKYDENAECSVITYNQKQNSVFFGTIKNFLKLTNGKNEKICIRK